MPNGDFPCQIPKPARSCKDRIPVSPRDTPFADCLLRQLDDCYLALSAEYHPTPIEKTN